MRGIFRIQHSVVDGQPLEHAAAIGGDRQPQIVAVDALVDLHGAEFHRARSVGAGQMKMSQHIGLQRRLAGPQLAPGDFAVAVVIQADREFAVANREFQRTGYLCTIDLESQKAVAGDVRLGQRTLPAAAPAATTDCAQRCSS